MLYLNMTFGIEFVGITYNTPSMFGDMNVYKVFRCMLGRYIVWRFEQTKNILCDSVQ